MNHGYLTLLALFVLLPIHAATQPEFVETDGFLHVEAERFFVQEQNDVRSWIFVSADPEIPVSEGCQRAHALTASASGFIRLMPDTRQTHDDTLTHGVNFSNTPGTMAILHYPVEIKTPGRYYVWVSAFSTGTEDNGIHVGLNDTWPESGQRMQWCDGKHAWRWESKQRTEANHCGEPYKIYLDIEEPGPHVIQFSMREDGFRFDQWLMTLDREYVPPGYSR